MGDLCSNGMGTTLYDFPEPLEELLKMGAEHLEMQITGWCEEAAQVLLITSSSVTDCEAAYDMVLLITSCSVTDCEAAYDMVTDAVMECIKRSENGENGTLEPSQGVGNSNSSHFVKSRHQVTVAFFGDGISSEDSITVVGRVPGAPKSIDPRSTDRDPVFIYPRITAPNPPFQLIPPISKPSSVTGDGVPVGHILSAIHAMSAISSALQSDASHITTPYSKADEDADEDGGEEDTQGGKGLTASEKAANKNHAQAGATGANRNQAQSDAKAATRKQAQADDEAETRKQAQADDEAATRKQAQAAAKEASVLALALAHNLPMHLVDFTVVPAGKDPEGLASRMSVSVSSRV
eukprot:gene8018-1248_t